MTNTRRKLLDGRILCDICRTYAPKYKHTRAGKILWVRKLPNGLMRCRGCEKPKIVKSYPLLTKPDGSSLLVRP